MKWKQVKAIINKMSDSQLEQDVIYNSKDLCLSGIITSLVINKSNLYNTGEDDPAELYTKAQLKNDLGMDNEEIESCDIEIPKGAYVINF
jgi:hypothetical protein